MRKLLVIYGPTATGKTDLALQLAKKFGGELISADSRQVYKDLDIGTGKLPIERLNDSTIKRFKGYWIVDGVKIHGFDLVKPGANFSAADFLKFSSALMIQIMKSKKLPIIVGGTGFYIKALRDGIESIGIPANQKLRRELEKLSASKLLKKLLEINPQKALSLNESDRQNPRRLVRAIEIASFKTSTSEESKPTSEVLNGQLSNVNCLIIGLTAPNSYLYERADKWLSRRITKGMFDEVQNLINQNVNPQWLDTLGLEYRWITRHLLGKITKEEATERLKGDIHSFIRRQKTWFRKFPQDLPAGRQVQLFDISVENWRSKLEKIVKDWYTHTQSHGKGQTTN